MSSINGIYLLGNFDYGNRALNKLEIIINKLTTKTARGSFGLSVLNVPIHDYLSDEEEKNKDFKSKILSNYSEKSEQVIKENRIKVNRTTQAIITKTFNYTEKPPSSKIGPYISGQVYTYDLPLIREGFKFEENPSEIIEKFGFMKSLNQLRSESPQTVDDFNLVAFDRSKFDKLFLYRGLRPFYIAYSLELNCLIFTTNEENISIVKKEDLLKFKFIELNLDPYSIYILDPQKINDLSQEIIVNEDFCCKKLTNSLKSKKLILNFSSKKLYSPGSNELYSFCPFCGQNIGNI